MKILFLRSNPVNPDSRVEKEVLALINAGYNVEIFAWDREREYKQEESELVLDENKIRILRVGIKSQYSAGFRKNIVPLLRFQYAIMNFLKKNIERYDVVHACDFDTAFAASRICFYNRIRFVYDVFDYYVDSFSVPKQIRTIVEKVDTSIMNRADAVIICTEKRREQIKKAKPKRLYIIHNSPAQNYQSKNRLTKNGNKVKIAYIGILSKGRYILEMCDFVANNAHFELHIGGFGLYEKEVQEYAKENENIYFYGRLSYQETLQVEEMCDIITAIYDPSIKNHVYAAPNKFYEGLMLGKPLIMVKGTGMSEIVEQNDIGCVADYTKLNDAFLQIASRKADWRKMATTEKDLYEKYFSWETMQKRLLDLYKHILADKD